MNLPKKLKQDEPQYPSFIVDELNKAICTVIDTTLKQEIKEEIIKLYNRYNKLVIALVVVSTLLVFAVMTIVNLCRFKLV